MSETTEIVKKLDPAEFGLDDVRADQIATAFFPTVEKMKEFIPEFDRLDEMEMTEEKCRDAGKLRKRFVKVRTGTATIHKGEKSGYLAAGKYCDAWKNAQLEASKVYEDKLRKWETHYELIEEAKIEALRVERAALLEADTDLPEVSGLGEMTEEVWTDLYSGAKTAKKARIEAEEKEEADRIKKEAAEKVEADRIRTENARLKQEQEAAAQKEAERKAEADKKEAEAEAERQKERDAIEAKHQAERDERDAKLRAEQKKAAEAVAELRAKQEAEEEAKRKEEAAVQAELQKGDSEKLAGLIDDLAALKTKYEFESDDYKDTYQRAGGFIDILIQKLTTQKEKAA